MACEPAQLESSIPNAGATAVPSSKALGKRRLDDDDGDEGNAAAPPLHPQPPAVANLARAVQKRERRVTRSSRGAAASEPNSPGTASDAEGNAQPRYLPPRTLIRLITKPPPNLVPVSIAKSAAPVSAPTRGPPTASTSSSFAPTPIDNPDPSNGVATVAGDGQEDVVKLEEGPPGGAEENPLFRLLDETELLPPRGTRHTAVEVDTSDAFYHRLHRYPEVLEKRAARLERERLIHERSKLINELEELRGRTWVYAGTSAGGRAEEERQRRIKLMSERLARYDALLPNQPRKSNFLNLAGAGAVPGPSNLASSGNAGGNARETRTASPALHAPAASALARSQQHPVPPPRAPVATVARPRPSTPVSASASNSSGNPTTIRIKFGPPPTTAASRRTGSNHGGGYNHDDDDDDDNNNEGANDLERYTVKGELRKGPKRDRRAERARAEERRKLGLKPRSSLDKAMLMASTSSSSSSVPLYPPLLPRKSPVKRARRRTSRAGVSYAETDNDDEEEEDDGDDEEGADGEADADAFMADGSGSRGTHYQHQHHHRHPPPLVRKRLPDSFFHSVALRDAFIASMQNRHGSGAEGPSSHHRRRASARVAYAFGQRLPDPALVRQVEFELHGGVDPDADSDGRVALEEMVRARLMERHGEEAVVLGGHVLPKSAVDAWSKDPLHVSPLAATAAAAAATTSTTTMVLDSSSATTTTATTAIAPGFPSSFVAAQGAAPPSAAVAHNSIGEGTPVTVSRAGSPELGAPVATPSSSLRWSSPKRAQ
ncbi:hypothetical protein JCM3774_001060 [Rhodotorula dairenensis]